MTPFNLDKAVAVAKLLFSVFGLQATKKVRLLMWHVDSKAFVELGDSITGLTYVKTKTGSEPDPKQWAEVLARIR
jgi:hypothetical protein